MVVNSEGQDSFTSGIAGAAKGSRSGGLSSKHPERNRRPDQGNGYVGGMVGVMEDANLYNSYVNGTIGGNGSRSRWNRRKISGREVLWDGPDGLARWPGPIRERQPEKEPLWEPETGRMYLPMELKRGDNPYLFTRFRVKAKHVFGSVIDGDNISWKMPI